MSRDRRRALVRNMPASVGGSRSFFGWTAGVVLVAVASAVIAGDDGSTSTPSVKRATPRSEAAYAETGITARDAVRVQQFNTLRARARDEGPVNVIVEFDVPNLGGLRGASIAARGPAAAQADNELAAAIQATTQAEAVKLPNGLNALRRTFRSVPFAAMVVSAADLAVLEASPAVAGITEDRLAAPILDNTVNIVGASDAWNLGFDGSGLHVAILDTGIRASHDFFAGKNIVQACFALGQDGVAGAGDCPNGLSSDTASADAARHHTTSPSSDHGTHVAGIATGNDAGFPLYGVARGADLIAIQVFSQFFSEPGCGGGDCVLSWGSDQIAGLDFVYSLRNTLNIASANLSLGGGFYDNQAVCDSNHAAQKAVIDNLRAAGIATVIASGNDGFCAGIGGPGCISSAIAVGATTDADFEASFNNFHPTLLDIFAPGVTILSSVGGSDSAYNSYSGTSMATPHLAGAYALMRHAFPSMSVGDIFDRLHDTGQPVTGGCGVTVPQRRIQIDLAILGFKFNQPPEGEGEDIASNVDLSDFSPNIVAADDFVSDGRPIHVVQWWGSELGEACPAAGDCCTAHASPGCDDADCCTTVCGADPFCCDVEWDGLCADEAASLCTICAASATDDCDSAPPVGEGAFPFSTVGANTDGPAATCGALGSDVWLDYTPTCSGTATIHTCGSTYDTAVEVFNGCSCGPVGTVVTCNDDAPAGPCVGTLQSYLTFPVTAGNCYKIRLGGFNGQQGSGTVTIACSSPRTGGADQTAIAGRTKPGEPPVPANLYTDYGAVAVDPAIRVTRHTRAFGPVALDPRPAAPHAQVAFDPNASAGPVDWDRTAADTGAGDRAIEPVRTIGLLADPPPLPSGGSGAAGDRSIGAQWVTLDDYTPGEPPPIRRSDPGRPADIGEVIEPLSPAPRITFQGVVNSPVTGTPPDTHIAVGPGLGAAGRVVMVTNGHVQIWDKTGSVVAGPLLLTTMFSANAFDPKVLFDEHSGRFFIVTLEGRASTPNFSVIHIAVSSNGTPNNLTTDWTFLSGSAVTNIGGTNGWADYPGIGADSDSLFITANVFTFSSPASFLGIKIRVLDKAALLAGVYSFVDLDFDGAVVAVATTMPAHVYGTTTTGGFYLVSRLNASAYRLFHVTGDPGAPAVTTSTFAWSGGTFPADAGADQCTVSNPDLDTLSSRVMTAVYRDGHIWLSLTADPDNDGQTEVVWQDIAPGSWPVSGTPSVFQSGFIDGTGSNPWTYMPAINVNAAGDAAITYTQSSTSECPAMYYVSRLSTAPLGTFESPTLAATGSGFYDSFASSDPDRWGDYSATVVDPTDDCFWVANEIAFSSAVGNSEWATSISSFCADDAPLLDFTAFGWESVNDRVVGIDLAAPETLALSSGQPNGGSGTPFWNAQEFGNNGDFSFLYALNFDDNRFSRMDVATGAVTDIGVATPVTGQFWGGLAMDPTTGVMYASSTECGVASHLYTVDLGSGAVSPIGAMTNSPCNVAIAIDGSGQMFAHDIANDSLIQIDKATGAGTIVGPLGFNANFAQGMDFDESDGTLYLAAFNDTTSQAELRIANTATGATTMVGGAIGSSVPGGLTDVTGLGIAEGGAVGGCGPVINGDFETGDLSGWTVVDSGSGTWVINDGTLDPASPDGPLPPCGGNFSAMTDSAGPGQHTLYQDVTIPAGWSSACLNWTDMVRNHAGTFSDPNQEFRVEIRNPATDAVLETVFSTDPGDPALQNCTSRTANIAAYIGQTIRIAFVEQDDLYYFNVHLDDVCITETGCGAPAVQPDGWLISFHEPLVTGGSPEPPLGLYFCDRLVVESAPTALPACDGHPVIEYAADLADCCLIHANVDSRSGQVPAQPDAFLEEECFDYGIDIQAVVGSKFSDDGFGNCTETPTAITADDDFWGWHTTDIAQGASWPLQSALESVLGMAGSDWVYGPWQAVVPTCSNPNMAFALITNTVAPTDPDPDGDGVPDACLAAPPPFATCSVSVDPNARFICAAPPSPPGSGAATAIRVELTSIGVPPGAPSGRQFRYVNAFAFDGMNPGVGSLACPDDASHPDYACARLGCEPEYRDWTADLGGQELRVTGDSVVSDSTYTIEHISDTCGPAPGADSCPTASAAMGTATGVWGDIVGPSNGPPDGTANVLDIGAVVDKVKGLPTAFDEPRCWMKNQHPRPDLDPINVLDIGFVVDPVKGLSYPFAVVACP